MKHLGGKVTIMMTQAEQPNAKEVRSSLSGS
jgi:hypothetical protein